VASTAPFPLTTFPAGFLDRLVGHYQLAPGGMHEKSGTSRISSKLNYIGGITVICWRRGYGSSARWTTNTSCRKKKTMLSHVDVLVSHQSGKLTPNDSQNGNKF
jgi:hypothetical protein